MGHFFPKSAKRKDTLMGNKIIGDLEDSLVDDGKVAPNKAGLKRYPFVFLIDVSGSTGDAPDPDIVHINNALASLMDTLRKPTPSSDLAKQIDQVDVCMIAYSDEVNELLPWRTADQIPTTPPHLVPLGGTSTAKALEYALARIGDRLAYYDRDGLGFGMPHIIHLTDGAMNDAKPGSPRWDALKSRLCQLDGRANSEKRVATLMNFISPKGCQKDWVEVDGRKMSGIELLSELTGPGSIYELGKELSSFEGLVKLITVTISYITRKFTTRDAVKQGSDAAKKDRRTEIAGRKIG